MSEKLSDLVPTNWCDPLLTGPDSIGEPPYDCRTIEKLLRGIQDRLRKSEATRPAPSEEDVEAAAKRMALGAWDSLDSHVQERYIVMARAALKGE